jgi:hypothetical protein
MERDFQDKNVDWPTVVEYFTKRGRPATKQEIQSLIKEDNELAAVEKELE